jgi:hypothetical protein
MQLEDLRQIVFDAQRAMQQQNLNTQEGKNVFSLLPQADFGV